MSVAFALLVKHWREALIGAAVLGLMAMCRSRDNVIREKARAEVLYRQADSTLKAVKPQLARVDTLLQRDTVKVRVAIDRVVTLRDTLLRRLTDTVTVREYITRTDSALAACSELSRDCAAFRLYARQTIDALELKVKSQPAFVARSCTMPSLLSGILGATGGVVLGRTVFKP